MKGTISGERKNPRIWVVAGTRLRLLAVVAATAAACRSDPGSRIEKEAAQLSKEVEEVLARGPLGPPLSTAEVFARMRSEFDGHLIRDKEIAARKDRVFSTVAEAIDAGKVEEAALIPAKDATHAALKDNLIDQEEAGKILSLCERLVPAEVVPEK